MRREKGKKENESYKEDDKKRGRRRKGEEREWKTEGERILRGANKTEEKKTRTGGGARE
jgi:hypothetical protein